MINMVVRKRFTYMMLYTMNIF